MALINCPECGEAISDKANNCINCGFPLEKKTKSIEKNNIKKIIALAVSVILLMIVIIVISNNINGKTVIRNVKWNMTMDEIVSIEEGMTDTDDGRLFQYKSYVYDHPEWNGIVGQGLTYKFNNEEKLKGITITFEPGSVNYNKIYNKLCELYGVESDKENTDDGITCRWYKKNTNVTLVFLYNRDENYTLGNLLGIVYEDPNSNENSDINIENSSYKITEKGFVNDLNELFLYDRNYKIKHITNNNELTIYEISKSGDNLNVGLGFSFDENNFIEGILLSFKDGELKDYIEIAMYLICVCDKSLSEVEGLNIVSKAYGAVVKANGFECYLSTDETDINFLIAIQKKIDELFK